MNHSISLGELIEKVPLSLAGEAGAGELGELHATLSAHYEAGAHEVVAELDAYVCPDDASHMMEEHLRPGWLPEKQVVRAGGDAGEASDIARDVFHSWVRRVRESVPGR
jgi:hypothetical protein